MQMKNVNDTIYRQAAIDELNQQIQQCDKALADFNISMKDSYAVKVERASLMAYKEQLEYLPSAQPESLTDKEKRIFLAAMGREEKVCKKVDDECRDCREPYEDSLVRTCRKIIRKVKGALWT